MKLKTFAILLSLSAAYSSATYAMDPDAELERISQSRRAADEAFPKIMQTISAVKARQEEQHKKMSEKLSAEDQKLLDVTNKYFPRFMDDSMTPEELTKMTNEFEEIKKAIIAEKERLIAEDELLLKQLVDKL